MKKQKTQILLIAVVSLGMMSCNSRRVAIAMQPTTTEELTQRVEEVKRDTVLLLPPDRSQYRADLAIQGNRIVVKDASITRSAKKVLQPPVVKVQDNTLIVDCEVEAEQLFFEWKDKYIKEQKRIETKIPIGIPLELSSWQQTQIWLGRLFVLFITLGGLGFFLKTKT